MKRNYAWILASLVFSGLLGLASISVLMIAIPSTSAWAGTLKDNFDDGNMDGWDLSEFAPRDTWEVKNGALVVTPRDYPVGFSIGETTWKDYTIRVRAKIVKYQPTGALECAAIWARSTSYQRRTPVYGYVFGFGAMGNKNIHCFRVDGNPLTGFNTVSKPFEWELDKWYDLKLIAEGDYFKFYVNDELVIEYTDTVYPAGKVGIAAAFSTTTAHFDDFSVTGNDVLAPIEAKGKLATSWGKIKSNQ